MSAPIQTPLKSPPRSTAGSRRPSEDATGKPPIFGGVGAVGGFVRSPTPKKCRFSPCLKADCPFSHETNAADKEVLNAVPTNVIVVTLHSEHVSRDSLHALLNIICGEPELAQKLMDRMPYKYLHIFQSYPLVYLNFDRVDEAEAWMQLWTASDAAKTYFVRAVYKRAAASDAGTPTALQSGNRSRAESIASAASS